MCRTSAASFLADHLDILLLHPIKPIRGYSGPDSTHHGSRSSASVTEICIKGPAQAIEAKVQVVPPNNGL